ncbi:MFS transporter [Streptomyces spongiae]|uniref:MFS transporter n=1 Tax=Streptomyces spongiae TaxID=565072 RepID=A0A5N8XAN6_9ACTN|nr:MFS transporter [Streptomyces spongiae]MPY56561.1 MFS transporter [Streptomyces spongiae]
MTANTRQGGPITPSGTGVRPWLAIGAYGIFMASTQLPWLTYGPVTNEASAALGVSEGAVGDLAVVVPLFYVILGIPSGRWLDRWFRPTLVVGTVLSGAGAVIRAVDAHSFAWALAGQIVLSVGQPLVINAITKLPARHFTATRRTVAVALVTAAQFVGILVAASTGSWLMAEGGLTLLVGVHAVVVATACAVFLASLGISTRIPAEAAVKTSPGIIRMNRDLWLLAGQLFIGFGLFNALATWLDTIQTDFGNPDLGGALVTVITVAGIVGCMVLPTLATRFGHRRRLLMLIGAITTIAMPAFLFLREPLALFAVSAIMGFVLMAGMPAALDWSEVIAGREHAGAVAGFLMVIGNLGGTLYVLAVQPLLSEPEIAILVLTLLAAPWALLAQRHRSEPARRAAEGALT